MVRSVWWTQRCCMSFVCSYLAALCVARGGHSVPTAGGRSVHAPTVATCCEAPAP